jgi:hypothetical protein
MAFDKPTFNKQDDVDSRLHIATLDNLQKPEVDCGSKEGAFSINKVLQYQRITRASCWCMCASALGARSVAEQATMVKSL